MQARLVHGRREQVLEFRPRVVGVQDRVFRDAPQPGRVVAAQVGIGLQRHAHVARPAPHPADAAPDVRFQDEFPVLFRHARHRQEFLQRGRHAHGAGARSAAAVRRRKRLVQVQVQDVHAEVRRLRQPHQRVEVRPVHVEQRARRVRGVRDLPDLPLEQPQGVRHGQHHHGRLRPERRLQGGKVQPPVRARRHGLHRETAQRGGGRIRSVRRIRHQDFRALPVLAGPVVGRRDQDAREFAVRARRRLQGERRQPRQGAQHFFQPPEDFQGALRRGVRRGRMQPREAVQRRDFLVGARVVLHRARTQRIKMGVQAKIQPRQSRVVPHHVEFRQFRQARRRLPQRAFRQPGRSRLFRPREPHAAPSRHALFDREFFEGGHVATLPSAAANRSISSPVRSSVAPTSRTFFQAGS